MAVIVKGGTLPDTGVTKNEVYALVDNATVSSIVNADIDAGAAIADTKLATISTAGKVNTTALVTTSQAAGDVMYNDGTNWVRLTKDAGKYLKSGASAASWDTPATSTTLGTWASRSNDSVYQAATDGFVVAYCNTSQGKQTLIGFTDSSNPPTTARCIVRNSGDAEHMSIMFPVRKGDYYKATGSYFSTGAINWIPLGT